MDNPKDRWKGATKKVLLKDESKDTDRMEITDEMRQKGTSVIFEAEKLLRAKKRKPRFLTRAMAEEFGREDVLTTTSKEALIYFIFIISVTICTVGRRSSSMFYITQALKGHFLEKEFSTSDGTEIKFENIQSITDVWQYTEEILVTSFYAPRSHKPTEEAKIASDDHRILYENKILGVPRIRQVQVRANTCKVDKFFKNKIRNCYAPYSTTVENHGAFGLKKKTAWVYTPASKAKAVTFEGKVATYDGGGFYQDLSPQKNDTKDMIQNLKKNLWITRATRAVFIDFSLYNANLNLFCICKFIFELPPTGGVIPDYVFQAVQLLPYVDTWDYTTFAFEIIVYIILTFYIVEEIREATYFKLRYFIQFWTYVDLLILSMALGYFITAHVILPDVNKEMEEIKKHPHEYGNLEKMGEVKDLNNNFAACLLFFNYIKLFKYLNFNKTMGQLNNTLKRCAVDIFGFSVMFFIIFFAFAVLGYLVFGTQVADFRNFGVALFTLLRTILGDFDFESIERANSILAPLFFLSYIFFVFFVLLNMFLAIINDTYADVKTEIAIAPDEMQMTEFLKQGFLKLVKKCNCFKFMVREKGDAAEVTNTTHQKIRTALKECGFSDLEIEMFFARYNIDPLAEVGEYDSTAIMKELERQRLEKLDEEANLVNANDFRRQQERVEQIGRIIEILADKIDNLIQKLETFESVRKSRM